MSTDTIKGLRGNQLRKIRYEDPFQTMSRAQHCDIAVVALLETLLETPRRDDVSILARTLLRHLSRDLPERLRKLELDMAASIARSADAGEAEDDLGRMALRHQRILELSYRVVPGLDDLAAGIPAREPLRFLVAVFTLIEALRLEPMAKDRLLADRRPDVASRGVDASA